MIVESGAHRTRGRVGDASARARYGRGRERVVGGYAHDRIAHYGARALALGTIHRIVVIVVVVVSWIYRMLERIYMSYRRSSLKS